MGETYRSFYSDPFNYEAIGSITGSSAISRFPNVPGYRFKLQAPASNIGTFYFGTLSGTNQQYWEVAAGEDTDWFNLSTKNLNQLFFRNPSGSSQTLTYWAQN